MKTAIPLSLAAMIPLLGGCLTLAPEYERPDAPVPAEWPKGPAYESAVTGDDAPRAVALPWREFFADPRLQQVIELAIENNRDLRLAILNTERARALYGVQRAELFPPVNATGLGVKQRRSADLTAPTEPRTVEQYEVSLGIASWEIDLFGRIRSLKAQALQEYLATEQARRGAQIALISEVAVVWTGIGADYENFRLASSTWEAQRDIYELVRKQYEADLATEIDVKRARMQMDVARVDLARFTQRIAQGRNALNLLAGVPVSDDLLPADLAGVQPFPLVSPGLPSETLLLRPDIMAAEHQLMGANALIGAARAAFFPRIGLTAAFGAASDELNGLFASGTGMWTFSPSIILPVFDARVWAANRLSKANQKILLAQYEQVIQAAFREVADVLAVRGTIAHQIEAQKDVVDSASEINRLAVKRYENGIDSYLSVLDAQRSLYGAEQGLVALQLLELVNRIRTYAVLGGECVGNLR